MGNQQKFSEQQGGRYTAAHITGLIAGTIIQACGWTFHNKVLAGLGLTVFLAPTIVAATILPKEPPLPWRKKHLVALIAISLVAGSIFLILRLNFNKYYLLGLRTAE